MSNWLHAMAVNGPEKTAKLLQSQDDEIKRLVRELYKAASLLQSVKCPDSQCDGNGTVCTGYYPETDSFDIHQCQWCDESQSLIYLVKTMTYRQQGDT